MMMSNQFFNTLDSSGSSNNGKQQPIGGNGGQTAAAAPQSAPIQLNNSFNFQSNNPATNNSLLTQFGVVNKQPQQQQPY